MRGILIVVILASATTASAQSVRVDVDVDVDVTVAADDARPSPPAARRYLTLTQLWTARDGDGYRFDAELVRGSAHRLEGGAWSWTAGVGVSRIRERAIYYGHSDEIAAQDEALSGFLAWALRVGRLETRTGLSAGVEHTSGVQAAWNEDAREVSTVAALAELYATVSVGIGPIAGVFGWRVVAHAERFDTLDGMDAFTREPTLIAFLGVSAALD